MLWLVLAAFAQAPTFEVSGATATPALPPDIAEAFATIFTDPPPSEPLLIEATFQQPSFPLERAVPPLAVEPPAEPQAAQAAFLAEVATLAGALDPATGARLADRYYTAAAQALVGAGPDALPEARAWMTRALPLYRAVNTQDLRHPERLAVRLAWAARLGGGTADDLDAANRLLRGAPDNAWTRHARLVLADAWMQPATWKLDDAITLLRELSAAPEPDGTTDWATYALVWAWDDMDEGARAIDTYAGLLVDRFTRKKGATTSRPPDPDLLQALRADGAYLLRDWREPDWVFCTSPPSKEKIYQALQELLILFEGFDQGPEASEHLTRLLAEDGDPTETITTLVREGTGTPRTRLAVLIPLAQSTWLNGHPELKADTAGELARAAAAVHYGTTLHKGDRAAVATAYALSLQLAPDAPEADAIRRLQAAL